MLAPSGRCAWTTKRWMGPTYSPSSRPGSSVLRTEGQRNEARGETSNQEEGSNDANAGEFQPAQTEVSAFGSDATARGVGLETEFELIRMRSLVESFVERL